MKKYLFILLLLSNFAVAEEEKKPEQKDEKKLIEEISETEGSVRINGKEIPYKAKAGTLILKDDDGKDKASVFYIAYTREDISNKAKRPITYCFNGGPGSSAIWLHIGTFGPRRAVLSDEGHSVPPYQLVDNAQSILDLTDLVFIDPVSTGYSRPAPGEDPKQFHGVEEDIKSVGEFIRLYTTRNNRWESPKFLAGESYGTTRAAGLAEHLQDEEMFYVDGLILLSTALNFQTILDNEGGNDLPYILFLPTYTSTAWYHKKLPSDLQKKPLKNLLKEVEQFAQTDYAVALLQGNQLQGAERDKIVKQVARYTGLSPEYVERSDLRVKMLRFGKELLRDEKRIVGRFDGRITGIDNNPCLDKMDCDPSANVMMGGFTAAFNHYVRSELKWEKDEPYRVIANVWPWDFGKAKNQYLNVADSLKNAMARNQHLHVFVGNGRYDLATPYLATEYTFSHLGVDPSLMNRVRMEYYDAGHMMYTHKPSLEKLKKDLTRFLKDTVQ